MRCITYRAMRFEVNFRGILRRERGDEAMEDVKDEDEGDGGDDAGDGDDEDDEDGGEERDEGEYENERIPPFTGNHIAIVLASIR